MGIRVDQLALVHDLQQALTTSPGRLTLVAVLMAAYALLELAEAVGLWTMRHWGEYLAVVATSVVLPWEIRELTRGLIVFHIALLVLSVAAVVYLLVSERLFGLRGGRAAYDAERRGEQLLEVEHSAARAAAPASLRRRSIRGADPAADPPDHGRPHIAADPATGLTTTVPGQEAGVDPISGRPPYRQAAPGSS